jgi:hypothetical protein
MQNEVQLHSKELSKQLSRSYFETHINQMVPRGNSSHLTLR